MSQNSYMIASDMFESLKLSNHKSEFDRNVGEYLDLVYGDVTDTSVMSANLSNINDYMDEFVIRFLNTIWTFSELPFVITKIDESEDEKGLYDDISKTIFERLKSRESYFKFALSEFVRSWKELGMGVMVMDLRDGKYKFNSVNPAAVQYDMMDNELTEVLIKDLYYFGKKDGFKNRIKHFKKVKDKWQYRIHTVDRESSAVVYLDYQPVFISLYNTRLRGGMPTGKGIELLPVLKNINNILKKLDEAGDKELSPIAVINSSSLDMQIGDPNISRISRILGTTTLDSSSDVLADTLRFEMVPIRSEVAYRQLAQYERQISDKMSVNEMMLSKGTARMTAQETGVRDAYDRENIVYTASLIIDEFLIPMLEILVDQEIRNIEKEQGFEFADTVKDYRIGINNLIAKADKNERLNEIMEGFKIIEYLATLDQTFQGKIDVKAAISEVSKLTRITSDNQSDQVTSDLLQAISENFSNQATQGIIDSNGV